MFYKYAQRLASYTAYRGLNFLGKSPSQLRHQAAKIIEHEPAQEGTYPPPVTLDGQIERVTGNPLRPVARVIRNATRIHQKHSATLLYKLDNVTIDNGFLFMGARAEYISSLGAPKLSQLSKKKEGVLCSTTAGTLYFGDWLITDNLLEPIANELDRAPIKILPHIHYFHLPDVNRILGLSETYLDKPTVVENLYIPEDLGYNKNRVKRLDRLRRNFCSTSTIGAKTRKCLYLLRGGGAAARDLINEKELCRYLQSIGFKIITPSEMSVDEIADEVSNSDIVIGVEGSQLSYGTLGLKEGGLMVTLQPPHRFQSSYRPRCEAVGVRWGFLVGYEVEGGFELPLDDLKRLLENYC